MLWSGKPIRMVSCDATMKRTCMLSGGWTELSYTLDKHAHSQFSHNTCRAYVLSQTGVWADTHIHARAYLITQSCERMTTHAWHARVHSLARKHTHTRTRRSPHTHAHTHAHTHTHTHTVL